MARLVAIENNHVLTMDGGGWVVSDIIIVINDYCSDHVHHDW